MQGRGRIRRLGVLTALAIVGTPATALAQPLLAPPSATPAPAPATAPTPPAAPLRSVPQATAVRLSALQDDPRYRTTFEHDFDGLTPENELKMNALQPHRGQYDFSAADELVRFAREHGKTIHGHALIWGLSLPLWLVDHGATDDIGLRLPPIVLPPLPTPLGTLVSNATTLLTGWRRDELLQIMRDHITTVMRHFAGDIHEWDVVNEPMAEDGTLSPSVWERFIGPDYVEQALRAAHAADPTAKLYINDYAIEQPSRKLDGLVNLVRGLLARGVPLDGIGLQMHTNITGYPTQATLERTMRRFTDLGLDVQVTEMDVETAFLLPGGLDPFQRQARAYGAAARACNAVPRCTRFTTWGFTDALSWLGAAQAPLLLDGDYRPKPAFAAVRDAFAPRTDDAPPSDAQQPSSWRWRPGVGARCGWGSCAGLRIGRG